VIYSIAYHQGMVDDLGGPDAFRRLVRSGGDLSSV
jgi:hypothetical protein